MGKRQKIINIILEFAVFVFAFIGVVFTSFGVSGLMTGTSILYYTVQSNIWIGLTCLTFAILRLINYHRDDFIIPTWLFIVKYVFVVAITLTMVVFWFLLAPTIQLPSYFLSPSNLFAHTLTPLAAIISFLAFDSRAYQIPKKCSLLSLTTPLYYLFFAIICSVAGVRFAIYQLPYFFLNFFEFGWFGFNRFSEAYGFASFGVFYWIVLILIFIFLLGFGYVFLNRLIFRKVHQSKSVLFDKNI
ncbi:MAG: hypothetical protein WC344_05095 [Bacilli bacterium]|jgi:hypothetical protein